MKTNRRKKGVKQQTAIHTIRNTGLMLPPSGWRCTKILSYITYCVSETSIVNQHHLYSCHWHFGGSALPVYISVHVPITDPGGSATPLPDLVSASVPVRRLRIVGRHFLAGGFCHEFAPVHCVYNIVMGHFWVHGHAQSAAYVHRICTQLMHI